MKSRYVFCALFAAVLALLIVTSAQAQEPAPRPVTDDEVNAIAEQLYCPVCENIPLDVCGTQACEQWRDEIRMRLARGESEEEIKEYFMVTFGDRVLATPPARGLNWLVYIVPPLAILAGVFILYRSLRAWQQPVSKTASPESRETPTPTDPYIARLEEELRKR